MKGTTLCIIALLVAAMAVPATAEVLFDNSGDLAVPFYNGEEDWGGWMDCG
ncbi:MAG: hypothetical protein GF393_01015, partial [Armatimonadia bacterium]|nr:hypothetical protein [Armatimonadia bacterium]